MKKKTPKDWLRKYYPVPASTVAKRGTLLDCVRHSLRKWEGLLVYEQFGMVYDIRNHCLRDKLTCKKILVVGGDSCALCRRFDHPEYVECSACPLSAVRLGLDCDESDGSGHSPWRTWILWHNPRPMIRWLKKAEKLVLKEQKKPTERKTQ